MPDEIMTGREALERAFAETREPEEVVEAVAETPADEPPSDTTDGRERDEFGRFKARDAEVAGEAVEAAQPVEAVAPVAVAEPAPSGFQASAQADWAKTPESVRADVQRRFGELEKGLTEYRQRFEPLKRYDEMARASGTSLDQALANYTTIEQTIARNPMEGLDLICRNLGTDIRTVAAQIMGQPAPEPNAQVAQLHQRLQAAETELRTYRAEKENTVAQTVQEFAAAHPRFDELTDDIAWLLKTGGAKTLEAAYAKADRLNPMPAAAQTSAAPPAPQPQKPAGPVSIKGAPSTGSNPARAPESLSSREAVARAFATLG
jgi:hypothetical protein